jgi:hypothetical protein
MVRRCWKRKRILLGVQNRSVCVVGRGDQVLNVLLLFVVVYAVILLINVNFQRPSSTSSSSSTF